MVNSRRKTQGEIHDQEIYRMRSDNLRPSHEIWKSTVPPWEKQFCSTVGSIPWRKFLEMKNYMHLYDYVINWNDSAGEEAFNEAKNRFWAKIKGLPCDISLPDPDIYIDLVDWDSGVDPELLLDLEREPKVSAEHSQDENAVPLTEALLLNRSFSCTGWGDTEESFQKVKESHNCTEIDPRERYREHNRCIGIKDNERSFNFSPRRSDFEKLKRFDTNHWNNATGWYDSRYKVSRFPSNDHQMDRAYRERRKRMNNFAHEKHALRQWAMKS